MNEVAPSEPSFSSAAHHHALAAKLVPRLSYDQQDPKLWRQELAAKVRDLVGLPVRDGTDLAVRYLWEREDPAGTITRLVFSAEEQADVPCYFCRPSNAVPPYPTVICLQGHTSGMHNSIGRAFADEQRPIHVPGDRDFALTAMRNGFAALCVEQRAFGERARRPGDEADIGPGCHDPAMQALLLGRTLLGERVFDVDRALDYLDSREDVAPGVGVMGNSGGGTVSIYAAALLGRIAFAMPSCSFATLSGSIFSVHHCVDNYVPGLMQWAELADILGLFAPRPVVVVTGRDDEIFPLPSVLDAYAALRQIYADAGAEDACALVIGDGGHRFYAEQGWASLKEVLRAYGPSAT
jgi:dienelactone hydrolase